METDFARIVGPFLNEALSLLGIRELGFAVAAFVVLVTAVAWGVAKTIDREEPQLGAALSSGLMLALMAAVLGVSYLALLLKDLCTSGSSAENPVFLVCAGICGIISLVTVHGAFGTAWWRSLIMIIVVAGAAVGSGWISHQLVLGGRATQLPILAAQTAGLKTDAPSLITSEPLKKIAAAQSIRVERNELTKRQEQLVKTYHALQERRARLNTADATALAAFNQDATAYSAENAYIRKRAAELDALAKVSTPAVAQTP